MEWKNVMRCCVHRALVASLGVSAAMVLPSAARAADDITGWSDVAELSYVFTSGNSESGTFGFKNQLRRVWDKSSVQFDAGGIRVASTTFTRFAVGTPGNFSVLEDSDSNTTAENYFLTARYDRKITERLFWFAGGGWDRNVFAGIQNRYAGFGGVGNIWVDKERIKFRTDYSLTFTRQDDVVENPAVNDTFAGVRFGWNYLHLFGPNTTYGNDLIVDDNLDQTSDYRASMVNWTAVSMTSRLALKVSLQWLYDNEPSLRQVDLYDIDPVNPAAILQGQVAQELDNLDTIFTTSLVVKF